jgi:hypothetical protein
VSCTADGRWFAIAPAEFRARTFERQELRARDAGALSPIIREPERPESAPRRAASRHVVIA